MSTHLGNMINIAASGMSAESIRMNVTSSNLANAGNMGTTEASTYHVKRPVFTTILDQVAHSNDSARPQGGVYVSDIIPSNKPLEWRHDPDNPLADENGKVYLSDVNTIEEMADMIDASRHYQALAEIIKTGKSLALQTIRDINS